MDVVRPISITPASGIMTDTSVEYLPCGWWQPADGTTWLSGTTYAIGDLIAVSNYTTTALGGKTVTVYRSLANSNTNHTPASSPTWWEVAYDTYMEGISSNSYHIGDRVVLNSSNVLSLFNIGGYDSNGNPFDASYIYETLTDGYGDWFPVAMINPWAAFDGASSYATTYTDSIMFELTIGATDRVDTIGFLSLSNVAGVNVTVTVAAVEVYNEDFDLTTGTGVDSWLDWFFTPSQSVYDLSVLDMAVRNLPNDAGAVFTITLTGTGTIGVGEILMGQARDLGESKYDLGLGITDYSRVETDAFGVRAIVQRSYAKRMSGEVWVEAANTSFVFNLLASLRATPVLMIGSDSHSASVQYGMLKSWTQRVDAPSHSTLSLEFEGL